MNLANFGYYSLILSFPLSLFAFFASIILLFKKDRRWLISIERAFYAVLILVVVSSLILVYGFLTHDFSLEYVYQYSDRYLPIGYLISAFWAGQSGSLLLWMLFLSIINYVVVSSIVKDNKKKDFPLVSAGLSFVSSFFISLLIFASNPFKRLPFLAIDGQGLNPLLQDPAMIYHPPTLFLGYAGYTIPFVYAITALIKGEISAGWFKKVRFWSIFSWLFLTIGIILGAKWAYIELGWGGYWAWDPVENASLLPWLIGTALLHSLILSSRKGWFKNLTLSLMLLTFILCIFATYLTRSGILSSVHAFGDSMLGNFFLIFIAFLILMGSFLFILKFPSFQTDKKVGTIISKDRILLLTIFLFIFIAFVVFYGTIYPAVVEMISGIKLQVQASFFNKYVIPIAVVLLLFMGICTLSGWKELEFKRNRMKFLLSISLFILTFFALIVMKVNQVYFLIVLPLAVLVGMAILYELGEIGYAFVMKIFSAEHIKGFIKANRKKIGASIVHLGLVLIYLGILGSSLYKKEYEFLLKEGEKISIYDYSLSSYSILFHKIIESADERKFSAKAYITLFKGEKEISNLYPEKSLYRTHDQQFTEVAVRSSLLEDIYVILAQYSDDGTAIFKILINPLIFWLWLGSVIACLGGVISLFP